MGSDTYRREERNAVHAAFARQSLIGFALATALAVAVIAFTRTWIGRRRTDATGGVADLAAAVLGIPAARDTLYLSSYDHLTRLPAD